MKAIPGFRIRLALIACLVLYQLPAFASHMIGDDFTYKYLGDSTGSGTVYHKYEVTLILYEDCQHGQPQAIYEDNPAFFGIYNGSTLYRVDSIFFSSSTSIPVSASTACGVITTTAMCVLKKTFIFRCALRVSSTPYTVVYQRCCKNSALTNIVDPIDVGSTYFIMIPAGSGINNNSAVFNYYPPLETAINSPFVFDHSATDADGDSLSYELCNSYIGADNANIKPFPPSAPPFTPSTYVSPMSYSSPVQCSVSLAIDPVTGMLTGTPNLTGCYLVTVCCNEWRGGTIINTTRREFELIVVPSITSTYHPYAGPDTVIYVGDSVHFHASGAASYSWSPATYLSSTGIFDPAGYFTTAGTFPYVLYGVSDSGCTGYDTMRVMVLEHSELTAPNAFTPNGDYYNDYFRPFTVLGGSLLTLRVYNKTGQLIYSGNGNGQGWDGKYRGTTQPMDTYMWQATYIDNKGATHTKTGSVTLVR